MLVTNIINQCKKIHLVHPKQYAHNWNFVVVCYYCQTSNISYTFVGNKIVAHPDVVGASPVGAALTTSSFSTQHLASMDWAKTTARRDEKHLDVGIRCVLYYMFNGSSFCPYTWNNVCTQWQIAAQQPHVKEIFFALLAR